MSIFNGKLDDVRILYYDNDIHLLHHYVYDLCHQLKC